jgi:hypothetical protein
LCWLAPHVKVSDIIPIGCLVIVGDQAYHCCVIGKLDDAVVHKEYRTGLSMHP